MKMDIVAGSGNDEHYTPPYAVTPILEFIDPAKTVWCPFDTQESHFVRLLKQHGCNVIATHIESGQDFLSVPAPPCDLIVSNPPYSKKNEVFERAFALQIPFAFLVGVVGLFESQRRFELFAANKFEILYLNKRVAFFKNFADQQPSLNPPFSSVYLTSKLLPDRMVFRKISKSAHTYESAWTDMWQRPFGKPELL